jgi:hypothetical protein
LKTEEAGKNALVMPFISALGYNVFNPLEVIPEFIADVGTKKGEKVDYAIKRGDEVIILIEVKQVGDPLSLERASQLYRYFSVTKARIAILTTGVVYRFYSDLDAPNKMDALPFLEIDLLELRDQHLSQLKRLTKDEFDLDTMLAAAEDLKFITAINHVIDEQLENPNEDFVRFFFSKISNGGRFTQAAKDQFSQLVKRAFTQAISDRVGARLRSALQQEDSNLAPSGSPDLEMEEPTPDDGIVTTEEELKGFRVVQAILCDTIDPDRVVARDTKSYFGILVDDNNRKPIARLHFNRSQWYLGLFNEKKKEERHPISNVKEIYGHAAALREAAKRYLD